MIELKLKDSDFKQILFTTSPCFELVMAFRSFLRHSNKDYFSGWIERAQERLSFSDFPYLTALVRKEGYIPDFLTPTPIRGSQTFETEISSILKAPKAAVMNDIKKVSKHYGLESSIYNKFFVTYKNGLEQITDEMCLFWEKALVPYWGKCKSFLESDILYRAKQMAMNGIEAVFENIGKGIEYSSGSLKIDKKYSLSVEIDGKGLMLMPSVFSFPDVYIVYIENQPVTVIYPIKETHLFSASKLTRSPSLQILMGATSAIILELLDQPRTTFELSLLTRITPGAVSQQLGKLFQTDLVNRFRDSKLVYYVLSEKGRKLVMLVTDN